MSTPRFFSGSRFGVADLEREVARVRPEEVQLLEGRRPHRARDAHRDRGRRRSGRSRTPTEPETLSNVARPQPALRREARVVEPRAELQRDVRPRQFLVRERRDVALVDRRRQRLLAGRRERARHAPPADGARQPAERAGGWPATRTRDVSFSKCVPDLARRRSRRGGSAGARTCRGAIETRPSMLARLAAHAHRVAARVRARPVPPRRRECRSVNLSYW